MTNQTEIKNLEKAKKILLELEQERKKSLTN